MQLNKSKGRVRHQWCPFSHIPVLIRIGIGAICLVISSRLYKQVVLKEDKVKFQKQGGLINSHEQGRAKSTLLKNKCDHPRRNQFKHQESFVTPGNCSLGWGVAGTINSGQNLEDGVIFNRFFSGSSPLAHLGHGNGNGRQVGGIYLEMGALDGITFSNSRLYEYCAGWDGILVEAQPNNVKKLYENRPCAVIIPEGVCSASADGSPSTISMSMQEGTAFDLSTRESSENVDGVEVLCRPLSVMLEEYDVTRINFFSLDVEGSELKVLETFDFEQVRIDVLMVETDFIHNAGGIEGDEIIDKKVEAVRNLVETRSNLTRVPSRLDEGKTDSRLCERAGLTNCVLFSIAGSDLFVSPELYLYDTEPWTFISS
jgi:FkbM family methyltransferase